MANKTTRSSRTPKVQSTDENAQSPIESAIKRNAIERNAIERNAVKRNSDQDKPIKYDPVDAAGKRVDEQGDLEEETLDRDAPFNRTYGIE